LAVTGGYAKVPLWKHPESGWGMPSVFKSLALMLALTAVCASHSFAGDNWARDLVRKREAAVFARAGGPDLTANTGSDGIRPLVVGGIQSPPHRWPFQAGLLVGSIANNFQAQFCAGTIIDEEFILTAAHCAEVLSAAQLRVLTGTQSLAVGGTRHAVQQIKIHPGFNDQTFDFDIALIQLKTRVREIAPPKMADMITTAQDGLAKRGTDSFVIGWGNTGISFPTELREVSVPIVSNERCNAEQSYDGAVTPRMLCAGLGRGGKDSCQGDSGGPLIVKDNRGRLQKQAGIVSWGNGCALPHFYGVYTRVAVLEPWVTASMEAIRASAVSALACEIAGNRPSAPACRRAAKEQAEREIAAYLDVLRRAGTDRAASAAQRSWRQSTGAACAFAVAINDQLGREDCIATEARKRADALAMQISELGPR
jgi:secreted trypsin-like serine protease